VRQAEVLRDFVAASKGYPSWDQAPEPLRGLIELAAEVRVFRRALARPLWSHQFPPARYLGVAELERRILVALGLPSDTLERGPDLEAIRRRYAEGKA
jgi:hypothetical protein